MKREVKTLIKEIKQIKASKQPQTPQPHHEGKGTKARLNTAAENHFFNFKYSK